MQKDVKGTNETFRNKEHNIFKNEPWMDLIAQSIMKKRRAENMKTKLQRDLKKDPNLSDFWDSLIYM